jgi:hypothetical protein
MKLQIRHGVAGKVVVVDEQAAASVVARMIESGLTNILVARADADVTVAQVVEPPTIVFNVPIVAK